MPLAPRHGTAPWEALLGRLVLCAALCVCRGELPPAEPPVLQFRPSARCNASCGGGGGPAPSCAAPPARLPFCAHLPMRRLLLEAGSCRADRLARALHGDQLACQLACEFRALLSRFDCLGGYSAKWNCHTCAVVYREWTCAMLVPVYGPAAASQWGRRKTGVHGSSPAAAAAVAAAAATGAATSSAAATMGPPQVGPATELASAQQLEPPPPSPLRPCRQFCHRVEEQCPYFHPTAREQYAGEPVFICIDPNIPDLPSISNSSYGPPGDCYEPCHVNASFPDNRPCGPDGRDDEHLVTALDSSVAATTAVALPGGGAATSSPPLPGEVAAGGGAGAGGGVASGGSARRTPWFGGGGPVVTAVVVVTVWWAAGRTRGRHRLYS